MDKGKYINKLTLVRQHRKTHYLDTLYKYMDKVSKEQPATPDKVDERWNKNKAVK